MKQIREQVLAIQALKEVTENPEWKECRLEIYSDNQYKKNGSTSWINNWKKNGWKTAAKKPVLNKELWLELDSLYSQLRIDWKWVKGHAGVKYNEICDRLCHDEMVKI